MTIVQGKNSQVDLVLLKLAHALDAACPSLMMDSEVNRHRLGACSSRGVTAGQG